MPRATTLACSYGISAYDATYIALAEKMHVPLLTADSKLEKAMTNGPYQVIALDSVFAQLS